MIDWVSPSDLVMAAGCLNAVGHCIGMPHPAVIDDYSSNRLLTTEDGRALAGILGWEPDFYEQWVRHKLYLVSPIAAVCRMSTKPFTWEAAAVEKRFGGARPHPDCVAAYPGTRMSTAASPCRYTCRAVAPVPSRGIRAIRPRHTRGSAGVRRSAAYGGSSVHGSCLRDPCRDGIGGRRPNTLERT